MQKTDKTNVSILISLQVISSNECLFLQEDLHVYKAMEDVYSLYFVCNMYHQRILKTVLLKPQDSFGEFDNFVYWSSESAGNHQKTPSDLPAIVLNDIL